MWLLIQFEILQLDSACQDEEKRMSTWLTRSSTMNKIDGSAVLLFLTVHAASEESFCQILGKSSIVVQAGTESSQVRPNLAMVKVTAHHK